VSDALYQQDLSWARALAAGDPRALARYESELVPIIRAQLRRRHHTDDEIADLQQTLRARLFVGDGGGPAVAKYAGMGQLRSWVLVAALRESTRSRQKKTREPATDDEALIAIADRTNATPVAEPGKERYREAFRAAFREALASLTSRDRNLLRMHLIDGLSIDQIGAIQGVHRATAARWIERAREDIASKVRRRLMKDLGADPFEADDVLRWVQSRIELSLSGLNASGH